MRWPGASSLRPSPQPSREAGSLRPRLCSESASCIRSVPEHSKTDYKGFKNSCTNQNTDSESFLSVDVYKMPSVHFCLPSSSSDSQKRIFGFCIGQECRAVPCDGAVTRELTPGRLLGQEERHVGGWGGLSEDGRDSSCWSLTRQEEF